VTNVQTDLCNLNQLQQVFQVQQVKLQQVWQTLVIRLAEHSKTEEFFIEQWLNDIIEMGRSWMNWLFWTVLFKERTNRGSLRVNCSSLGGRENWAEAPFGKIRLCLRDSSPRTMRTQRPSIPSMAHILSFSSLSLSTFPFFVVLSALFHGSLFPLFVRGKITWSRSSEGGPILWDFSRVVGFEINQVQGLKIFRKVHCVL